MAQRLVRRDTICAIANLFEHILVEAPDDKVLRYMSAFRAGPGPVNLIFHSPSPEEERSQFLD